VRTTALYLYVEIVDEVFARVMVAGGRSILKPEDQFYGDRCAGIEDPEGNTLWMLSESRI
jgi:PhnB protein